VPDFYPLASPLIWHIDPERAHRLALLALRFAPSWALPDSGSNAGLGISCWGKNFSSPIGLAAGFDKDANAIPALFALGFGFIEVGGVTLRPQIGNPRPRLFRLSEDRAAINRMGLNSAGADVVAQRLKKASFKTQSGPLAVNLGLNKDSAGESTSDYAALAGQLAPFVDILTINVSSPNTPGLRALQYPEKLAAIVSAVRRAVADAESLRSPAVLVKIAPNLQDQDVADLAALALSENFDGLVISNTTTARPETLQSDHKTEQGGLSGAPLFESSTNLLRTLYRLTEGRITLIGVGGISSGADAYAKIRAGASLVQLYSGLVFEGPGLVGRIKSELADLLATDGFATVADAVGVDHRGGGGL
jgi:dihydroorotate dehydrogenase